MSIDGLPLKLIMTRWYNSMREWILDDVRQMLGNTVVGGKVVGSTISGTIPTTSVPYSGSTPASVAATATVGTATSGAPHADHQHAMGIVTTKGDLLTFGTAPQRHASGSDNSILTADSSKTDGLDYKQTITITGEIQGSDFKPSGVTGATAASAYKGATASGAPVSGTFSVGDFIVDQTGTIYVCTTAGSPGTWTSVTTSGGSGAPTAATYLTQSPDATLTAEIAFPGASAWADASGRFDTGTAGGISEEYETSTTSLTWTPSTPATVDSNTTVKSHLYVSQTDSTERFGYRSWSPGSGAFDARWHLSRALISGSFSGPTPMIADSGNSNRVLVYFPVGQVAQTFQVQAFTFTSGSYTQRGSTWANIPARYARITRDGSNNVSFYFSVDGLAWILIATQSFTFTVANIGYRMAATPTAFAADWLRTNV